MRSPVRAIAPPDQRTRLAFAIAALLLAPTPARAHDFWIEPTRHRVLPGTAIAVTLRVGSRGESDTYPRNPAHVDRFVLLQGANSVPVPGDVGDDPAGHVVVPGSGPWWIGYRSQVSSVALDWKKFEAYAHDEGLERIVATGVAPGETGQPAQEMFSRCAKALVWAGEPVDDPAAHAAITAPLGFTLELVPERDPTTLPVGKELVVHLLFNGAPLAHALVDATWMAGPRRPLARRTDDHGRVSFRITNAGVWMLAAVHMERTIGPARAGWESWWANLTFER